ncbi:MAG TPA: S1/P1 nuclease [Caulobacteraceae bacterium]|nr:S1/P1 nuclease [Caulobacteraceae bacterium]
MRALIPILAAALAALPSATSAWNNEGHEIIAAIARDELTPLARAWVDHMLAEDTGPDMLSQAAWADTWVASGHPETAQWHFVDLELDAPDMASACHGFPKVSGPASAGPADDCIVGKLIAFEEELANPSTPEPERILALKYVLHLVGDIHQPLHASDHHDRHGECVTVSFDGRRRLSLHAYWDSAMVESLGPDPVAAARALEAHITRAQKAAWTKGSPTDWAQESYALAKSVAYTIGSAPGCGTGAAPIALRPAYQKRAQAAARVQLAKAGVRLAAVLNRSAASAVAR